MAVVPFTIVNPDGSINQSEYERCINFINDYISGQVKVYPKLTWANPVEIDMSQEKSAAEILASLLQFSENKLLNNQAFNDVKKLFKGLLDRYGSTIHTYGKYLEQSINFNDGPGYMYDVLSTDEKEVKVSNINDDLDIYYIDDENHTVLEYNDRNYSVLNTDNLPISNYPSFNLDNRIIQSNVYSHPNVYKGNLCGVYSDFQRLSGQYIGSSTLFYYSECNDILYTTGAVSYNDERLQQVINFTNSPNIGNKSKPTRGITLSNVANLQAAVVNPDTVTAYIAPSLANPQVNYLTPNFFTSLNTEDWIDIDETQQ